MLVAGSITGKKPSAMNEENKLKVRAPEEFDGTKETAESNQERSSNLTERSGQLEYETPRCTNMDGQDRF